MIQSKQINILNIPFTTLFEQEILDLLKENLLQKKVTFIATPNPEMLLACTKNPNFKKILQSTDLNIPDGNGIIWANQFLNSVKNNQSKAIITIKGILSVMMFLFHQKNEKKRFNRAIHGSDLMTKICLDEKLSQSNIFLLGNQNGLKPNTSELVSQKIKLLNPSIKNINHLDTTFQNKNTIAQINSSKAEIVFVAFGAPHQETWVHENLKNLPTVKIIIGVGGSFDFIAGIIPRAPLWMRKIGLEWVYRLAKQPIKRLKRIYNAFIAFPTLLIKTKIDKLKIPDNLQTN